MKSKQRFKKGDTVQVIAGNDRGATGAVREILSKKDRVIVEGVNLRWKHKKPTQQNPKGERVQREQSIHASNVKRIEAAEGAGKKAKKKAAK